MLLYTQRGKMKVLLKRTHDSLCAADEDAARYIGRLKFDETVMVEVRRPRNILFHRKFFALLNVGFDAWEPNQSYKGEKVKKNFERFRQDVTILAGYYDAVPTISGNVRLMARSIAFGNMEEDEFEKLYNAAINVLLERVLTQYTRDDLDMVVE